MHEEETAPVARTYSDAEAAVDRARHLALRRSMSIWTMLIVAVLGILAARAFPVPALALIVGGACGVLNVLVTMYASERLLETRSVNGFVISSFLRIGLFGIVPVAFAAIGPWWSMAWYFAGFFLPLVLYAMGASRSSTELG